MYKKFLLVIAFLISFEYCNGYSKLPISCAHKVEQSLKYKRCFAAGLLVVTGVVGGLYTLGKQVRIQKNENEFEELESRLNILEKHQKVLDHKLKWFKF